MGLLFVKIERETLRGSYPSFTSLNVGKRKADDFIETFGALSKCLRALIAREYATFEVGGTQAKFVRYIGKYPGISQADLARGTRTDRALTGRALETLIERGWVRRKNSENDRRGYVLELTASGQRFRAQVDEARRRIAERVVAELDEKNLEEFDRIAKKLLAAFGDVEADDAR
jgi:DNA-binding MarR family transcriptional regulator